MKIAGVEGSLSTSAATLRKRNPQAGYQTGELPGHGHGHETIEVSMGEASDQEWSQLLALASSDNYQKTGPSQII